MAKRLTYPIVHLLRHSLDFVSKKDRKAVTGALNAPITDVHKAMQIFIMISAPAATGASLYSL